MKGLFCAILSYIVVRWRAKANVAL